MVRTTAALYCCKWFLVRKMLFNKADNLGNPFEFYTKQSLDTRRKIISFNGVLMSIFFPFLGK